MVDKKIWQCFLCTSIKTNEAASGFWLPEAPPGLKKCVSKNTFDLVTPVCYNSG